MKETYVPLLFEGYYSFISNGCILVLFGQISDMFGVGYNIYNLHTLPSMFVSNFLSVLIKVMRKLAQSF